MVNLATCFVMWWREQHKVIYQISPETADWLRTVNLNFIPETPPPGSWNGAVIIESRSARPLVDSAWSIAAYWTHDLRGRLRYFFCYLAGEDAYSFSIYADLGQLNDRLLKEDRFLADDILFDREDKIFLEPAPLDIQHEQLAIVRFVFATSYFIAMPHEKIQFSQEAGPPERGNRGKVIKKGGRVVPLWTYQDMRYVPPPAENNAANTTRMVCLWIR